MAETFGEQSWCSTQELIDRARQKVVSILGAAAIDDDGNLDAAFVQIPAGEEYLQETAKIKAEKDNVFAEADIYDHLYRFFERYYRRRGFYVAALLCGRVLQPGGTLCYSL